MAEDTRNASEVNFTYDKVRDAELRRNVWKFSTKLTALRAINVGAMFPGATGSNPQMTSTMLLVPPLWSAVQVYEPGSIIKDTSGNIWISMLGNNLNNIPGVSGGLIWDTYFGPMTVQAYDSTTAYFSGELVYLTDNQGHYQVYVSLTSSNSVSPSTSTTWSSTVTYGKGQVAQVSNSYFYMSLIDFNLNNDPTLVPASFNEDTSYSTNDLVAGIDGNIYISLINSNLGNPPTTDDGTHWDRTGALATWTSAFVSGTGSDQWQVQIGATLQDINFVYPIGSGPTSQTATRNVYMLPNGYLRMAPQDPKAGSVSYLGAPSGLAYSDWEIQENYIITRRSDPIVLRFIADVTRVDRMDPMFCEGLACRVALGVVEILTQSGEKKKTIASEYEKFMSEARIANGIETGAVEAAEDDWITTRL